jgi:hypothetical protein
LYFHVNVFPIFGTQSQDVVSDVSVSVSVLPDLAPIFKVIFLLGHWNHEGLGCSKRMSVPEIRAALLQIPGCSGFGRRPNKDLNVFTCFTNNRSVKKQKDVITSSTAQGGGGSFKNRKPIGEVGCCESGMAERSH